jgi:hypothetical protein
MRTEARHIGLVERREGVHVGEEAERLCHIAKGRTDRFELGLQIGDRLMCLCLYATRDDDTIAQTKLSGDDDPVTGTNDGGVRTNRCSHGVKVRRTHGHYPYAVTSLSRRTFLRTTGASLLGGSAAVTLAPLLAACGGTASSLPRDVQLVQRFPQNLTVGPVRIPISLAHSGGLVTTGGGFDTPTELIASVVRIDGDDETEVVANLIATRHDSNIATPYWPFRTEISDPGLYQLVVEGGPREGAAFQVFVKEDVPVPGIGDLLPAFDTPTFDDARGVDPVCTRRPTPCPLHEASLREALALGKPVVYLVGTPAHCSTGTCTPALDAIVQAHDLLDDRFSFLHAEVYADQNATRVAPAVGAVGMTYEPALFVTDERGVIVERLDAVFDDVELMSAIS